MTGRQAVLFVESEHPEWVEWVGACCDAQQEKQTGVAISAWDVAHALEQPIRPLGPLVRWGILEHVGDASRKGHRRYYRVREGVCDALKESRA